MLIRNQNRKNNSAKYCIMNEYRNSEWLCSKIYYKFRSNSHNEQNIVISQVMAEVQAQFKTNETYVAELGNTSSPEYMAKKMEVERDVSIIPD